MAQKIRKERRKERIKAEEEVVRKRKKEESKVFNKAVGFFGFNRFNMDD